MIIIMLFFYIKNMKNKFPVGGQAIIEGVMMLSSDNVAMAIRRKDGSLELKKTKFSSLKNKNKFFNLPFIRGFVSLFEMLIVGTKALDFSAKRMELDYDNNSSQKSKLRKNIENNLSYIISILLVFFIFIFLPYKTADYFNIQKSNVFLNFLVGIIRISLFIIYLLIIGKFNDIKKVFQYHGAEHITVNAWEKNLDLDAKKIVDLSTINPRCGTSFIFIVLIISIIFFSITDSFFINFFKELPLYLRMSYHIILVPLIAGISYEFLRISWRFEKIFLINILFKPGLWLQKLTTRKPTIEQIEVAILALKVAMNMKYDEGKVKIL